MKNKKNLPDVAKQHQKEHQYKLNWVGMENISVPISINTHQGVRPCLSKTHAFVNLNNEQAKGIHMSRLYHLLNNSVNNEFNPLQIESLLKQAVQSQQEISNQARLEFNFELLLKKPALLSDNQGFESYPIKIVSELKNDQIQHKLSLTICYSSTCPCSASLSRQLTAQAIDQQFPDDNIDKQQILQWIQAQSGSIATPHSQRSFAYIDLEINKDSDWQEWFTLDQLIFDLEKAIGTPVQTAVKREDEQEFARLNATNLMFCEDAARRVKRTLEKLEFIKNYQFKIEHQESLHAHNAVVLDQKY